MLNFRENLLIYKDTGGGAIAHLGELANPLVPLTKKVDNVWANTDTLAEWVETRTKHAEQATITFSEISDNIKTRSKAVLTEKGDDIQDIARILASPLEPLIVMEGFNLFGGIRKTINNVRKRLTNVLFKRRLQDAKNLGSITKSVALDTPIATAGGVISSTVDPVIRGSGSAVVATSTKIAELVSTPLVALKKLSAWFNKKIGDVVDLTSPEPSIA